VGQIRDDVLALRPFHQLGILAARGAKEELILDLKVDGCPIGCDLVGPQEELLAEVGVGVAAGVDRDVLDVPSDCDVDRRDVVGRYGRADG
jgi:hypothetical protein